MESGYVNVLFAEPALKTLDDFRLNVDCHQPALIPKPIRRYQGVSALTGADFQHWQPTF
jgi:hypothetical protein